MADAARARYWPWLGGAFAAGFVLLLLQPRLLLTSTVPSGYDLSGHLYPMWLAVHELIPRGRIHGWDLGWFGGFPVYYFYFPLPAQLAALLTPVVGFLPAAKIVSALGMIMLPLVVAWFVRRAGMSGVAGLVAVVVGSSFLLMQSYSQLGGNIASGLAGEFSYALSFALSLGYLAALPAPAGWGAPHPGAVDRTQNHNRAGPAPAGRGAPHPGAVDRTQNHGVASPLTRRWQGTAFVLPGILLAATALSHVVCVIAAVIGSLPLLRKAETRQTVLLSWLLAFALAAFWALPFLVRIEPVETVRVVNRSWTGVFRREMWPLLPLAVGGVFWASRQARRLLLLLTPAAAALLVYLLPAGLSVHPGRMLPYHFLAVHVFAGVGAGALVLWVVEKPGVRSVVATVVAALLIVWPHTMRDLSQLSRWAAFNYSGFSAKATWPELEQLLAELQRLPPGRIYWQDNAGAFAVRGSRHLFTLLPYWLPQHDALGGLLAESSPLSETLHTLDQEIAAAYADDDVVRSLTRYGNALANLSALGTRYFITSDARGAEIVTRTGMATPLATAGELIVFGLPAAPLVTARGQPDAVSAITVENDRIRFQTTATGVPHTIRVGYFANWSATGAAGPVRVPPNFMSVVPTAPEVVLRFRATWVEMVGTSVTAAAVVGLLLAALRLMRRVTTG